MSEIHPEIQELIDTGLIKITLENGFIPMLSLTEQGKYVAEEDEKDLGRI